ncbi:MAG: hypothetical protein WC876_06085 [Candidatus Thermoplasmatota archaeon]|jgi:hypothetical protein
MAFVSLGPSPRWRDATSPLLGLAAALALLVAAVAIEAVVLTMGAEPGIVLDWLPLAAAGAALLLSLRSAGVLREAALTATVALVALFPIMDPTPEAWMVAGPLAALAAILLLGLLPATRMVAAVPALAGALLALDLLPAAAAAAIGLTLAVLVPLALWFLVPHASGWRRVPFLAHLAAALLIPLAFLAVVLVSVATVGLTLSTDSSGFSGGPGPVTLVIAALAVAYPAIVLVLWRSRRAQAFTLPSLALPAGVARGASHANESGEQA